MRASAALRALAETSGRLHLAHGGLAGYSVFEEALFHGRCAADRVIAALRRPR